MSIREQACRRTDDHGRRLYPAWLWDERLDTDPPETAQARTKRLGTAQAVCHTCPLRSECLTARRDIPSLPGGMWGGELFADGKPASIPIASTLQGCVICSGRIPPERDRKGAITCGPKHAREHRNDTKRAKYQAVRMAMGGPVRSEQDCEWCGKRFTPQWPVQRYHSDVCALAAKRETTKRIKRERRAQIRAERAGAEEVAA